MAAKSAMRRKMPVKTKPIQLDGEFEGWEFTARVNPPMSFVAKLQSGDPMEVMRGVGMLIYSWNFVDEEGEPLPVPRDQAIEARKRYMAEVRGHKETPDYEALNAYMEQVAGNSLSVVPYDLIIGIATKINEAITQPEGN